MAQPGTQIRIASSAVPVLQQVGKDGRAQRVEGLGIAEELRDADQQLAEQQVGFVRVALEALDVGGDGVELQHLHAPLHAADQGILLVAGEVVADAAAQEGADPVQMLRPILAAGLCRLSSR